MNDEEIKTLSFVLASKRRYNVILLLYNNVYTPSLIANKLNIPIYQVSKLLSEMRSCDIVECINPSNKKGRIYKLTERGIEIYKILDKLNKE